MKPLDQYQNALIVHLKRSRKATLADVLAIWAWRCEMDPSHIELPLVAEHLWDLCERLDLMDHSLGSFPGGRGAFGVLCDAAPERYWALCLDGDGLSDSPTETHLYWFRIVSVLCSRLRMAEVARLPGYDHEAKAGPFAGGVL